MRVTNDGAILITVEHKDELTQVAEDIRKKSYASRTTAILINFYGEHEEAIVIAVQPSVCGEADYGVY